jgi:ubiquinone/menaquinone biosynthesis C-methylase UbiE
MSHLQDLQSSWNDFGQTDPLWAISSDPSKKGNKWDLDDFFNTGIDEIDALMTYLKEVHITVHKERALDFGCGVGRLTQALVQYFDIVDGVDIAPSMIKLANRLNRYGDRCTYHINSAADLSLFEDETFDLIYTSFVLQHMPPNYSKKYIKEFLRILASDGVLVFLMQSTTTTFLGELYFAVKYPLQKVYAKVYSKTRGPVIESHFIKQDHLMQLLEGMGAKVIDITKIIDNKYWNNSQYCVIKA